MDRGEKIARYIASSKKERERYGQIVRGRETESEQARERERERSLSEGCPQCANQISRAKYTV
jgi:hypothetical protein